MSLEQALRIPRAIAENYAFKPTRPLNVADAIGMTPSSGNFRMTAGAAVAYGLATGGAAVAEIGLTPLGLRIVRPTSDGDDVAAKREATLRPKVVGEFLRQYDGAQLPSDQIAKNVLQEKGVPTDRLDDVLALILENAQSVGFIRDISGKRYVDLAAAATSTADSDEVPREEDLGTTSVGIAPAPQLPVHPPTPASVSVGPGIHINIEIHIAADATSETVEEIFKNMRRYILNPDGSTE